MVLKAKGRHITKQPFMRMHCDEEKLLHLRAILVHLMWLFTVARPLKESITPYNEGSTHGRVNFSSLDNVLVYKQLGAQLGIAGSFCFPGSVLCVTYTIHIDTKVLLLQSQQVSGVQHHSPAPMCGARAEV